MRFGGDYVFSEGSASDGRKASRGSTNQNVAGRHREFITMFITFCSPLPAAPLVNVIVAAVLGPWWMYCV